MKDGKGREIYEVPGVCVCVLQMHTESKFGDPLER